LRIVIKIGGDLIKNGLSQDLVNEIHSLSKENEIVIVHGGGDIVTEIATKLGHPPKFVTSPKGFRSRYTDKETIEIFSMVMAGKINKEIISTLQEKGVNALGLSGLDGGLVRAQRKNQIIIVNERGRKMLLEGDYSGTISQVNESLFNLLLERGYVPVVSALAMGEKAEPLNVDGDRMGANIAAAIQAGKLILLTDVQGVLVDDKPLSILSVHETENLLDKIGPGMVTKLYASMEAVEKGVDEVCIASGLVENAITRALNNENGTVVRK
jgi:acetylglutamate/LysW-gamma-L-alpha-aminoadipate kinase